MVFSRTALFLSQAFSIAFFLCVSAVGQEDQEACKPEVISLLGEEFYATPAEGEELAKLEAELAQAKTEWEAEPENPEKITMYGRRLAYLWRYHEAIEVYSAGIEKFTDNAMLYRHRGHRYISTRQFEKAVDDLTRASELNDSDYDIWYHLALAHYLKGNYAGAEAAWRKCRGCAEDDDGIIAASNWLYISLRRQGKEQEAAEVLEAIHENMNVVENVSYFNLLLFYKGVKTEWQVFEAAKESELDTATVYYGLGAWHFYTGNEKQGIGYFVEGTMGKYWPAFGFIAAEAELARLKE
jgi:tetratricopeptide (TPR) repeat protein